MPPRAAIEPKVEIREFFSTHRDGSGEGPSGGSRLGAVAWDGWCARPLPIYILTLRSQRPRAMFGSISICTRVSLVTLSQLLTSWRSMWPQRGWMLCV